MCRDYGCSCHFRIQFLLGIEKKKKQKAMGWPMVDGLSCGSVRNDPHDFGIDGQAMTQSYQRSCRRSSTIGTRYYDFRVHLGSCDFIWIESHTKALGQALAETQPWANTVHLCKLLRWWLFPSICILESSTHKNNRIHRRKLLD